MTHQNHEPEQGHPDRSDRHDPVTGARRDQERDQAGSTGPDVLKGLERLRDLGRGPTPADADSANDPVATDGPTRRNPSDNDSDGDSKGSVDSRGPGRDHSIGWYDSSGPRDHDHDPAHDLDLDSAGDLNEQALRQLLRGAVDELEPSRDALDHLRRAVPARRTRRRQALVGVAAALVLSGAAVPALLHVATRGGTPSDHPANAASSHRTKDAANRERGGGSGGKAPGERVKEDDRVKPSQVDDKGRTKHPAKKDEHDKIGSLPNPSGTLNATSPTCTRAQLGGADAVRQPADAEGRVYGSFRVTNISGSACTVDGSGLVSTEAQGSADTARIFVVDHTAGDAATGLPDPAAQTGTLILQPGQAYLIDFAWIPATGGGTTGCASTGSSPTPDPSTEGSPESAPQDSPGAGEPSAGSGSGGIGGDGGEEPPPSASVVLSHTPESGAPMAGSTVVTDACAGTIYRTGLLAAS